MRLSEIIIDKDLFMRESFQNRKSKRNKTFRWLENSMDIIIERIDEKRYKYYTVTDKEYGILKIVSNEQVDIEKLSGYDTEFGDFAPDASRAKHVIYKMLRDGKLEDKVMKAWG